MVFQFLVRAARVSVCAVSLVGVAVSPAVAATLDVPAGGDLQAVLNLAQPGDVILLAAGATYVGNFRLPVKDGATDYITIRTNAAAADLPAPGVRVTPQYAPRLAKIKSPNTSAALATDAGTHHWRFESVEFQANVDGHGDIILLGASASQTQLSQMPHDFVFDRVYIHGDPVAGQKRGIALNSGATQIVNSYIADIKSVGQDSQAIAGWNGAGPFLIENNYLEGAAENVLFGGADPSIPDLVPSDITIRRNLVSKPVAWRAEKWQVKNGLELKNARRVLIEGNVFENVWVAAQAGFAILLSTRNQDGKAPWSIVEDITFRNNVVRHAANGINISGYDDTHPSQQGHRYRISNNILYDIDGSAWGGGSGAGIFLQVGNEPRDVTVDHNTVDHKGNVLTVYGTRNGAPAVVNGFVFRDNLMRHNTYGVKGPSLATGQATLAAYFTTLTFEYNVLAGGAASLYPASNYFPSVAEFDASFVSAAAGNYALTASSPFRTAASDGAALGADVVKVSTAQTGAPATPPTAPPPPASTPGATTPTTSIPDSSTDHIAVCRPGFPCATVDPSWYPISF